jgi:hypothetical protein
MRYPETIYEPLFHQSQIAPIFSYHERDNAPVIHRLHGTGFFIGFSGAMMTATHVIDEAEAYIAEHGGSICISPRQLIDGKEINLIVPINAVNRADPPFDISVCATTYRLATSYFLRRVPLYLGSTIEAAGYPASLVHPTELWPMSWAFALHRTARASLNTRKLSSKMTRRSSERSEKKLRNMASPMISVAY